MGAKKILVADDEPSILRSTEILLRDLGFDVVTTADHTLIPDILVKERADLLLQDVRMPGLDIKKLVVRIRTDPRTRKVPVILFSASLDLPEIQAAVGATGYIEKPFLPERIMETIGSALGN